MRRRLTHVVGFDDSPFTHDHRGNVRIVGTVYSKLRLVGALSGMVRRDGANATRVVAEITRGSRFYPQLHVILLQGIAFAGFNVVDLHGLYDALGIPVVTVARRRPDLDAIRRALIAHIPGGAKKWRLIEAAGPMEALRGLYVQRAGLALSECETLLGNLQVNGSSPEPLRVAHLIAGGVALGESKGRS